METILKILSTIADLLPLFLVLRFRYLLQKKEYILILTFAIISLVINIAVISLDTKWRGGIVHFCVVTEMEYGLLMFYFLFLKSKISYLYLFILISYTIYCTLTFYSENMLGYNSILIKLSVSILFTFSLISFVFFYKFSKMEYILENPKVWFILGYLIYTSSIFFLLTFITDFITLMDKAGLLAVFVISNMIKNLCIVKMVLLEKNKHLAKQYL